VKDGKTAINIIPLLLIPQIILGGALIKYEEMNRNLDFVYSIRRWFAPDQTQNEKEPSRLRVPVICEVMPLRWSYESLVLAQSTLNPYDSAQDDLDDRIHDLSGQAVLTPQQENELRQLKEALALVSGLEERTPDAVKRRLTRLMEEVRSGTFDAEKNRPKLMEQSISAEEVYQNKKISDLVHKAEFERTDVRNKGAKPNVFFGKRKSYLGGEHNTMAADAMVMLIFIIAPLLMLYFSLRRQLRRV